MRGQAYHTELTDGQISKANTLNMEYKGLITTLRYR